jgi:hypothetical protein
MEPSVYTVLQPRWIEACMAADGYGTFQSTKLWVGAGKLVKNYEDVPLFIRQSDQETGPLMCTHQAQLIDVRLAREFESKSDQSDWLNKHLTVQQHWIEAEWAAGRGDRNRYRSWEEQFNEWELSGNAQSFFTVKGLVSITQFPITDLLKASDGKPVSPGYKYGYLLVKGRL